MRMCNGSAARQGGPAGWMWDSTRSYGVQYRACSHQKLVESQLRMVVFSIQMCVPNIYVFIGTSGFVMYIATRARELHVVYTGRDWVVSPQLSSGGWCLQLRERSTAPCTRARRETGDTTFKRTRCKQGFALHTFYSTGGLFCGSYTLLLFRIPRALGITVLVEQWTCLEIQCQTHITPCKPVFKQHFQPVSSFFAHLCLW